VDVGHGSRKGIHQPTLKECRWHAVVGPALPRTLYVGDVLPPERRGVHGQPDVLDGELEGRRDLLSLLLHGLGAATVGGEKAHTKGMHDNA
jgi:hypothetical protein